MTVNRGAARGLIPQITWPADTEATTIAFALPLDEAISFGDVVGEAQIVEAETGEGDGWSEGWREYLAGVVRRIPREDTGGVTGWEGAGGWDAFLAFARAGGPFFWYPDAASPVAVRCELAEVTELPVGYDEEVNGMRALRLVCWSVDGTPITGY